jgi:hypothetical protein
MSSLRILTVENHPSVCAELQLDGRTYPIASIDHLLAHEDAQLAYKGPLFAALYSDGSLTSRQEALVRNTLKRTPDYFDRLYERIRATISYTVLFHDLAIPTGTQSKKRKR